MKRRAFVGGAFAGVSMSGAHAAPPKVKSGDIPAHATLVIGHIRLQGSDPAPGHYESPRGFCIMLHPTERDAERLFTDLAEGGTVRMPLQETFWARRFGVLTDRFGVAWAINCENSE